MRTKSSPLFATFIIVLGVSIPGHAQLWSGIIDSSRAVNWSNAGATISTTRTQCVTSACNTVSSGTVTAASINSALASAPANTYVLVPAGTFTMSAGIVFPAGGSPSSSCTSSCSNITLRGSGSNSTFLVFTGTGTGNVCNGHDVCISSGDVNYAAGPTNTATWSGTNGTSGTYTQGATSILLSSKTNLAVGNPIILDQIDTQRDNGALYVGCEIYDNSSTCSSGTDPNGFQRGTTLSTIRGQQQIVEVTSISGSGPYTVGISPGIYAANWATGNSPGAWWATSPAQGDAVENISLNHTSSGGTGTVFFNCYNCWVKGIADIMGATTGTDWYHVGFNMCNHCTVRDSYVYGYVGDSYNFSVQIASDLLIENNIVQRPAGIVFDSDCEGCVVDYNFQLNPVTSMSVFSPSQWYHGIMLYGLEEGNIGGGLEADCIHGTHDLSTFFRNRWDGNEPNNGAANTNNTVALDYCSGTRYENAIGNVLGTPGYHNTYKSVPGSLTNWHTSVIGAGANAGGSPTDPLSNSTSMFWGNWDNVTNAVRWCGNSSNTGWSTTCSSTSEVPSGLSSYANAVPSSETLPPSFIYSSQPSWWPSGKAWPLIGPDVTGGNVGQCSGGTYAKSEATSSSQCSAGGGTFAAVGGGLAYSNPAMDCYYNAMGGVASGTGNPLAFDASTCYAGGQVSPPSPPSPPTNLKATVQ
ncbi:MAG: hypothetical protein ABSF66_00095 [Terriglobales bacterium]|jgi:hypothetical protein